MKVAGLRWPYAFVFVTVDRVSLFYSGEFFAPNLPCEGLLPREPVEGSRSLVLLRRRPKVSALLAAVTWVVISWLCTFVQYLSRVVK